MNLGKYKFINYLLFTVAISFFWTCSPELSYGVKSFIFDGVPPPYEAKLNTIKDSLQTSETKTKKTLVSIIEKNEFNLHSPYKDRNCESCHDRDNMGKTKLPIPELCNQCHTDFSQKFETLHGPVASNNCILCHSAHQSKLKSLLVEPEKKLCFSCHDSKQVSENTIHKNIKNTSCTQCHNPHGGRNNMSLQSESCYNCHNNYRKEYKFLHGPVDSGNCFQCHGTHKSKAPKFLINTGDNLCFDCHNSNDIIKPKYHTNINNNGCVECHNPHGGKNDKFLLNKQ
ncbi:cytochrome c3 family protein [Lutibacter sp.]